jgi:hypothetical protein
MCTVPKIAVAAAVDECEYSYPHANSCLSGRIDD